MTTPILERFSADVRPGWFLLYQIFQRRLSDRELALLRDSMTGPPWHRVMVTNVAPRSPGAAGSPTLAHGVAISVLHLPDWDAVNELVQRPKIGLLPIVEISLSRLEGDDPLGDL